MKIRDLQCDTIFLFFCVPKVMIFVHCFLHLPFMNVCLWFYIEINDIKCLHF